MWSEGGVVSRSHSLRAHARPGKKFEFYSKGSGKSMGCFRQRWSKMDRTGSVSLQHSSGSRVNNICEAGQRGGEEPFRRLLHLSIGAEQRLDDGGGGKGSC